MHDYVEIIPPATLNPNEQIDVEVRVLGNGVTVSYSNGTWAWVPAEALISFNGGSYSQIFYGDNTQVNPNSVVWSRNNVNKNQTIRFGGRYRFNNSWGPFFHSSGGTLNVRTLAHGDTPPMFDGTGPDIPTLEDFIGPYLDSSGKVNIGPMDVIVFMELTHYDHQMNDPGYDMQDMVLLVTFKPKAKVKNNNGHGNNIDGADSSNPGKAPFIYLDTDPNFDDEGKGGGAAPSHNNP